MALKISDGTLSRAQKLVVYGGEGLGKTTLASQMPEPLIIDLEKGSSHISVRRITDVRTWEELFSVIEEIIATAGICKTLVIDTADKAEEMCVEHICTKYRKSGIEEFGYGKGYAYLAEEFSRLLKLCDRLIEAGIHVAFIAHAKMRKMELPDEQGAFDRWELKLSKQVAPLLKEWPDALLFLNYKTVVVQTDTAAKAQGGKRVIYASHHPCWDAKNRHGLPEELPLEYTSIAAVFNDIPAYREDAHAALQRQMDERRISEYELRKVVAMKGHFPETTAIDDYPDEFISGWVLRYWEQIVGIIENDPERVPF